MKYKDLPEKIRLQFCKISVPQWTSQLVFPKGDFVLENGDLKI